MRNDNRPLLETIRKTVSEQNCDDQPYYVKGEYLLVIVVYRRRFLEECIYSFMT
jgi:hypothetical protein